MKCSLCSKKAERCGFCNEKFVDKQDIFCHNEKHFCGVNCICDNLKVKDAYVEAEDGDYEEGIQ